MLDPRLQVGRVGIGHDLRPPGGRRQAICRPAAHQPDTIGVGHGHGAADGHLQRQRWNLLPAGDRPFLERGHEDGRGRLVVGIQAADDERAAVDGHEGGVGARRRQVRTRRPRTEVAVLGRRRLEHRSGDPGRRGAADEIEVEPTLEGPGVGAALRQRDLGRRRLPGHDRPGRHRAGQVAVGGVAQVDDADHVVADLDRLADGQVERDVGHVAEQEEDRPEPEERLPERGRPAVGVEQPEGRSPPCGAAGERALGHGRSRPYFTNAKSPCIEP